MTLTRRNSDPAKVSLLSVSTILLLLGLAPVSAAFGQSTAELDISEPRAINARPITPITEQSSRGAASYGSVKNAVEALTEKYRKTGRAEVLRQSNRIVYPFGHSQPVLNCAPLRTCAVRLQPGEVVMGASVGDPVRWIIDKTYMGAEGTTPVLLVRRKGEGEVTTNLVVTTNRRMYHLTLDSPPSREGSTTNPQGGYTREVSYYYPDDLVQMEETRRERRRRARERDRRNTVPMNTGVSIEELNFDYFWDRGKDFPWVPDHIFDDGQHVYIKIPPEARSAEAPLLFQIGPGDKRKILNYSIRNNFYITDRVFQKAVLVIGVEERSGFLGLGGKERVEKSLEIVNQGGS